MLDILFNLSILTSYRVKVREGISLWYPFLLSFKSYKSNIDVLKLQFNILSLYNLILKPWILKSIAISEVLHLRELLIHAPTLWLYHLQTTFTKLFPLEYEQLTRP